MLSTPLQHPESLLARQEGKARLCCFWGQVVSPVELTLFPRSIDTDDSDNSTQSFLTNLKQTPLFFPLVLHTFPSWYFSSLTTEPLMILTQQFHLYLSSLFTDALTAFSHDWGIYSAVSAQVALLGLVGAWDPELTKGDGCSRDYGSTLGRDRSARTESIPQIFLARSMWIQWEFEEVVLKSKKKKKVIKK